jgi:outer membrane protein OmpA-like peptidoglycan-associated protein
MSRFSLRRIAHSSLVVVLAITGVSMVSASPGSASEAGPSGFNIGFDFSWNDAANPAGASASFLETDGVTSNNCSGVGMTTSTRTCDFVFDYAVNGATQSTVSHNARWIKWTNPTTYTNGGPATSGCSSPTSQTGSLGKAPLTLFDCFNTNSFGQVFSPTVSGSLTSYRMNATCLIPSGTSPLPLYGLLYQLSDDGASLSGSGPLSVAILNMSKCPRATTWSGKTFKASDFAFMSFPFANASVTAGKMYAVYIAGAGVPGTPPIGSAAAINAAVVAASTTTTTTSTTTTTTTPWSKFKSQTNTVTSSGPTTTVKGSKTTTATTTPSATLSIADLGTQQYAATAVRLLNDGDEKTNVIVTTTPTICQGSGRNILFMKSGRCNLVVQLRTNGKQVAAATTKVVAQPTDFVASDSVVQVGVPATVYFTNGTAKLLPASLKVLKALGAQARSANSIFVSGFTGNAMGESANAVTLSQRRALITRSVLRSVGVTSQISIWSFGGQGAVSNVKSEAQQKLNRRALVYIIP